MPKREDEYWAGMKEPKGRGLCPKCGSSNISYNKRFKSWRCNRCENSFPVPSYGPGREFGKEARWFGKTTEGEKRAEFSKAARKARAAKRKKLRGGFSAKKTFLVLLLVACLAAAAWTGYLLFTDRIEPIVGIIVLVVNIGVLIWNISVLRKYMVGVGTVIALFLIIALIGATIGAFAGVEPLAGYKDNIINKFTELFSGYDVTILPGQLAGAEDWAISLGGGGWQGSTLIVELTITNLGPRRNFGYASLLEVGPELVVIDSTGKLIEPWVREPDISKGELFVLPPYTREFYPNESWSGSLKFEMSPYSGETGLYMTRFYHTRQYFLFDLGSPPED
ncbi:hypothetical protein ES703_08665 [subsurface metagenome]